MALSQAILKTFKFQNLSKRISKSSEMHSEKTFALLFPTCILGISFPVSQSSTPLRPQVQFILLIAL